MRANFQITQISVTATSTLELVLFSLSNFAALTAQRIPFWDKINRTKCCQGICGKHGQTTVASIKTWRGSPAEPPQPLTAAKANTDSRSEAIIIFPSIHSRCETVNRSVQPEKNKNRDVRKLSETIQGACAIPREMSDAPKSPDDDEALASICAKTRKSLIARLDNWEDQKTWDEFYQTYWKLIYAVAIKAGLRSDEAFDCVQETILSIAKQSKKKLYDPEQGSFKSWLMNMTRWRINDQFRKRKKDTASAGGEWDDERKTAVIDRFEDPNGMQLDRVWDNEWRRNMADAALARVKAQVSPKQYQIFDYYVLREWDATKVQKHLGVSMAQVYLAKHRVGSVLKKELEKLRQDGD